MKGAMWFVLVVLCVGCTCGGEDSAPESAPPPSPSGPAAPSDPSAELPIAAGRRTLDAFFDELPASDPFE